jgi:V-type H+-transporting ATPase subunit A
MTGFSVDDTSAQARYILQEEENLNEIVQLVGKDALADKEKIILEAARIIKDDFLQQNSFTSYDKFCPFYKSAWMLRNMVHFFNLATASVEKTTHVEGQKITYVPETLAHVLYFL